MIDIIKSVPVKSFLWFVLFSLLTIPISIFIHVAWLLPIIISAGYISYRYSLWKSNNVRFFAEKNRLNYQPISDSMTETFYFSHNYRSIGTDQISFIMNGLASRIFTYSYGTPNHNDLEVTYSSHKASRSLSRLVPNDRFRNNLELSMRHYIDATVKKSFTHLIVFEAIIPATIPHIFIDNRNDNTIFARKIDRRHRIKLEGTFDKEFNLYVAKEFHVEALVIMSPDFMAMLLDLDHKIDIELIGNRLLIYIDTNKSLMHEYESAMKAADIITNALNKKLKHWKFDLGRRVPTRITRQRSRIIE